MQEGETGEIGRPVAVVVDKSEFVKEFKDFTAGATAAAPAAEPAAEKPVEKKEEAPVSLPTPAAAPK